MPPSLRLLVHFTKEIGRYFFASSFLEQRHFSGGGEALRRQQTIREVSIHGGSGNITTAEVAPPICLFHRSSVDVNFADPTRPIQGLGTTQK